MGKKNKVNRFQFSSESSSGFNFQFVIVLFIFYLLFSGCENEISDQLQGKWQLKTVEEAGHLTSVDTVWYNFQSESLFMYQIYHPVVDTFSWLYGYKTQPESNIIHLEFINWTVAKENFLPFTDWKEPARTFSVDKVNRKQLVLKSDEKTYIFDRY